MVRHRPSGEDYVQQVDNWDERLLLHFSKSLKCAKERHTDVLPLLPKKVHARLEVSLTRGMRVIWGI